MLYIHRRIDLMFFLIADENVAVCVDETALTKVNCTKTS